MVGVEVVVGELVCGGREGDRERADRGEDGDSMDGVEDKSESGDDGAVAGGIRTGVAIILPAGGGLAGWRARDDFDRGAKGLDAAAG